MFPLGEIIEISDTEGETDTTPPPSTKISVSKKTSDVLEPNILLSIEAMKTEELNAVNLLIQRALDRQNIKQENNSPEPDRSSQVEFSKAVGNVTSTTDTVVKVEEPCVAEPDCSAPFVPTVTPENPQQMEIEKNNTRDILPGTSFSSLAISTSSADVPISMDHAESDVSTDIMDIELESGFNVQGEDSSSKAKKKKASNKRSPLPKELARPRTAQLSKTPINGSRGLKKAELRSERWRSCRDRPRTPYSMNSSVSKRSTAISAKKLPKHPVDALNTTKTRAGVSDPPQNESLNRLNRVASVRAITKTALPKNINIDMYASNADYQNICLICNTQQTHLANHYVRVHPDSEVFLSRISTESRAFVWKAPKVSRNSHGHLQFETSCVFCDMNHNATKIDWIFHLTRHTGEYKFKCVPCNYLLVRKSKKHSAKGRCKVIKIRDIHLVELRLHGYICNLCNFVQILEAPLRKHCHEQHGIDEPELTIHYGTLKLLDLNRKQSNDGSGPSSSMPVPVSTVIPPTTVESLPSCTIRTKLWTSDGVPSNKENDIAGVPDVEPIIQNAPNEKEKTTPIRSDPVQFESPGCTQRQDENRQSKQICLKPWTTISAMKNESLVKYMLRDACLFALFKCMSINCIFSTNSAHQMVEHLEQHQLIDKSLNAECGSKLYLECAYCTEMAQSNKELVQHVQDKHFSSIFMCQYCFYRSVDAYGVVVHLRKYHIGMEEVIVVGHVARRIDLSQEIHSLVENWNKNIAPIDCRSGCPKYFVKDQLVWHVGENHVYAEKFVCSTCGDIVKYADIRNHLSGHGIGDFQCLHCPFGSDDLHEIRSHMTDFHSNRLLFVWGRKYRQDVDHKTIDPQNVESTVIINIAEAVDNLGVRFREIVESSQSSLNSMTFPQFMSSESWNKFVGSMDAPVKLHDILQSNILQQSSKNLISWTNFKTKFMERESADMCRKLEDNLGEQLTMLPNLFPYYRRP